MDALGFGLTVSGLIIEAAALIWVALGIRKRVEQYGPRAESGRARARFGGLRDAAELAARVEELDATLKELRPKVGELQIGLRRLGLGDIRRDWIGLAFVAGGVLLALVGTVVSELA